MGQPGYAGCVSSADLSHVWDEWPGSQCGPRCSAEDARGAAVGIQEREVSVTHYCYGFFEAYWGWSGINRAFGWVLVVRGDLSWGTRQLAILQRETKKLNLRI